MKVMACILGLIAVLALRSALHRGVQGVVTSATTDKAAICLTMLGATTREENGFTYIVGSIRNNCNRKFDNVTTAFKLDRPPGSNTYLTTFEFKRFAVSPGETRKFKTMFHIGRNSTYLLTESRLSRLV